MRLGALLTVLAALALPLAAALEPILTIEPEQECHDVDNGSSTEYQDEYGYSWSSIRDRSEGCVTEDEKAVGLQDASGDVVSVRAGSSSSNATSSHGSESGSARNVTCPDTWEPGCTVAGEDQQERSGSSGSNATRAELQARGIAHAHATPNECRSESVSQSSSGHHSDPYFGSSWYSSAYNESTSSCWSGIGAATPWVHADLEGQRCEERSSRGVSSSHHPLFGDRHEESSGAMRECSFGPVASASAPYDGLSVGAHARRRESNASSCYEGCTSSNATRVGAGGSVDSQTTGNVGEAREVDPAQPTDAPVAEVPDVQFGTNHSEGEEIVVALAGDARCTGGADGECTAVSVLGDAEADCAPSTSGIAGAKCDAVSVAGDARASCPSTMDALTLHDCKAVSPTGNASGEDAGVTLVGEANGPMAFGLVTCNGRACIGVGEGEMLAVAPNGSAHSGVLAVGAGNASAPVAVSATEHANASCMRFAALSQTCAAASGTGDARATCVALAGSAPCVAVSVLGDAYAQCFIILGGNTCIAVSAAGDAETDCSAPLGSNTCVAVAPLGRATSRCDSVLAGSEGCVALDRERALALLP